MRKLFPNTLTARTIIVLVIGLFVSHLISMLFYSGDRIEALTLLGGRNMAQRIANVTHLVDETPVEWQQRITQGVSERGFQVSVTPESKLQRQSALTWHVRSARKFLEESLSKRTANDIRVQILDLKENSSMLPHAGADSRVHSQMMQRMHGLPAHQALLASIKLDNGSWLNFVSDIPHSTSLWSSRSIFSMITMAIAVILLSVWVVNRLSSPLQAFASAARRLGRDVNAPPLDETGPQEVRDAAIAFNEMQSRLTRLINNRTRMLGAISHDLRTPITLLKLRTETFDESDDKTKMLASLEDMESMIAATLEYARQEAKEEDRSKVDIGALIATICDDMIDANYPVTYQIPEEITPLECQQIALKRAVTNLIENAVKYGSNAQVTLYAEKDNMIICVNDDGPGIPEAELEQVFQPFYRCDESRSPTGGGVGLGLSLAKSIARNHGGDLLLRNRPEGGLTAKLSFPT